MSRPDWCPDDVLAAAKKAAYAVEGTHEEGWITSANGVDVIARAILAERERCARVVLGERLHEPTNCEGDQAYNWALDYAAAAIRAGATP